MATSKREQAKSLLSALGCQVAVDSETLSELIESNATIKAFLDGEISFAEAVFVETYLGNGFDVSKAVSAAQYQSLTRSQAGGLGYQLLRRASIKKLIAQAIAERAIEAEEVLARYAEVARSSIEEFVSFQEARPGGEGAPAVRIPVLDLEKATANGKMHLLKELKFNADGSVQLKMRDQDHAMDQLARHMNLFEKDNEINLPPELVALMRLGPDARRQKLSEYSDIASRFDSGDDSDGA